MTIEQFWQHTPREFYYRQKGYYEKEYRNYQAEWERTRWQTLFLLNVHLGKEQLKATDLIVFPWENHIKEKTKIDPVAEARMIAAMDAHATNAS